MWGSDGGAAGRGDAVRVDVDQAGDGAMVLVDQDGEGASSAEAKRTCFPGIVLFALGW